MPQAFGPSIMNWWLTGIDCAKREAFPPASAMAPQGNENPIMLSQVKTLKGYSIQDADGEMIGTVKAFYFDDRHWTIRYLVADTGTWLSRRQVLVSPYALVAINHDHQEISTDLTRKQIEKSPFLDSRKPVSRQFEDDYYGYFGWPAYWIGQYPWGANHYIERDRGKWAQFIPGVKAWDRHLRRTHELIGYQVTALDGDFGRIEDFMVDDETWSIRYLIVDAGNGWPGKFQCPATKSKFAGAACWWGWKSGAGAVRRTRWSLMLSNKCCAGDSSSCPKAKPAGSSAFPRP